MKCPKCQSENPADSSFCRKCGSPLISTGERIDSPTKTLEMPSEDLARGTVFADRFEVIEELGKGGMGVVYRVFDKKVEEEVALKLLNPEVSSDKTTIERFRSELKLARKISHKNVCRMYDLNEKGDTQYITMEYVPGEDLKSSILRIGHLSVGKAVSVAKQVCEGLEEAHRLGVIHRDLKPQNIMIDKEGNVRIMDFGIARSLKKKGITGTGLIIGTPEYMSPEQAEMREIDPRSDVYSLGVILYEMTTGGVPFEGETPLGVAMKHKSEEPLDPRKVNVQIPEGLSRVILKCLEKKREERYQNASELLSELVRVEKGLPTTQRITPQRKSITEKEITVKLNVKKLVVPAASLALLAVLIVVLLSVLPRGRMVPFPEDKPSLAVMYFENNTGDETFDHWRKALSDLLIADLSQSKYLRVLSGERLFSILEELDLLEAESYSSRVLKEISARGGVRYILVGKVARAGETLRINALLQEPGTGDVIGSEMVEGVGEGSLFSMVDDLTTKIKQSFQLTAIEIAADIDMEVEKITTSSPEAYRYYREGLDYYSRGDFIKSIPLMEMAVALDPDFAMAYRNMAIAYEAIGYRSEAMKRYQKAFELSDKVSDRESYYIQGAYYLQSEKTYDKAIEAYSQLLKLYPDDSIGNNQLGALYTILEEWDKAVTYFQVNIQNRDERVFSYGNISMCYAAQGQYDRAEEALELYLKNVSDNASIHFDLAENYIIQEEFDLAKAEVEKASFLDPDHYRNLILNGDIDLYNNEFINADQDYQRLLETDEPRAHVEGMTRLYALYLLQGKIDKAKEQAQLGIDLGDMFGETEWSSKFHSCMAYLHLESKDFDAALKECGDAWNTASEDGILHAQREALFLKGLIYTEMSEWEEAQAAASELKKLIDQGMNKKAERLYYLLTGRIELEQKNYSRAVDFFRLSLDLLPSQMDPESKQALFIQPLALAYFRSGDLDKAVEEYERIISLTTGRLLVGDIYAKSFYMLGQIYEQRGMRMRAAENYQKFLELWENADSPQVEVSDAQKRLASLNSQ